jgi:hypothetical protein
MPLSENSDSMVFLRNDVADALWELERRVTALEANQTYGLTTPELQRSRELLAGLIRRILVGPSKD